MTFPYRGTLLFVCSVFVKVTINFMVREMGIKFGPEMILTLEDRDGEVVKVWGCSGLVREREPLEEKFLCSYGLTKGSGNQLYFSYELATV